MSRSFSIGTLAFLSIALVVPASLARLKTARQFQPGASELAQRTPAPRRLTHNTVPKPIRRNPQVARIVSEIDARHIERTIRKLVSLGTRNTLSVQNDPARGIGAARDWLYQEFVRAAAQSGGRMTVEKQSYLQEAQLPPRGRVPKPTVITNIVATLKGSQRESVNRVYVVSGHYDSICGNPTDAQCDAPGANDDASGTAAVLEMARVMAKYKFEATIIL
jgi:acetylornithine deacetylase/succinyl-diaminopimelate desuccinylase-like protein